MIGVTLILLLVFMAVAIPVAVSLGVLGIALEHIFSPLPLIRAIGEVSWSASNEFLLVSVPMSIAGIAFFTRIVENSLRSVPAEVIDVATASGGSPLQIITGQGRRVWIRILGEAARAPGGQIGWVQGVMQNIDEHKRAEAGILTLNAELEVRVQERTVQLEALNREMQAFSYSVAHDLRSPLNTVSGFGQMLLKSHGKNLDDKGRHCLARIQEGAR